MNLFNVFSFGTLIKTFLPGAISLLAAIFLVDGLIFLFGEGDMLLVFAYFTSNAAITVSVVVLGGILFGVVSNTFVFMSLLDLMVRDQYPKTASESLIKLEEYTERHIINDLKKKLPVKKKEEFDSIKNAIDFEMLIMPKMDMDQLKFIQESYWYYMEFDLNLCVSIVFSILVLALWVLSPVVDFPISIGAFALIVMIAGLVCLFLWKSAKRNYVKYRKKYLSLCLAYFSMSKDE